MTLAARGSSRFCVGLRSSFGRSPWHDHGNCSGLLFAIPLQMIAHDVSWQPKPLWPSGNLHQGSDPATSRRGIFLLIILSLKTVTKSSCKVCCTTRWAAKENGLQFVGFLLQSSEHGKHLDLTNHISLRTEWMAQVSVGHMAMALFDITPHHNRDVTTNRWQTDKQWHEPCKLHGIAQRLRSFCFSFSFGSFESFPLGVSFSFKSASSSTSQQQNNAWHSIPVSTWPLQSRPCLGSIFFVMSWNGKKRLGFLIKVTNCAILSMRKKPSKSNHWKV